MHEQYVIIIVINTLFILQKIDQRSIKKTAGTFPHVCAAIKSLRLKKWEYSKKAEGLI